VRHATGAKSAILLPRLENARYIPLMPDFRSYCPTPAHAAADTVDELTLPADESHHLVVVNRARRGDPVVAFDGRGREWQCELLRDSKNAAVLRVVSTRQAAPPLPCEITLAQALPKGAAMDAIVRKATEIGAARIVPLESERTQVHLLADGGRGEKKTDKWRVAAIEAAKQCGNPWLPEIAPVQNATEFMRAAAAAAAGSAEFPLGGRREASPKPPGGNSALPDSPAALGAYDLRLVASLHPGARTLKNVLADFRIDCHRAPKKALWLIGPEGDFSPAEMSTAMESGFTPVTLGPLVLRCETAAIYALSILSHELQSPPI